MSGVLKVRDPGTGAWQKVSLTGAKGDPGNTGPTGVSSVIVGDFGATNTPTDLPVDGAIPVDWDGPGNPATAYQMEPGQSLYYDKPADPLDGHLFQFITTAIDPTGWLDIGLIQGPPGPKGDPGPVGPPGGKPSDSINFTTRAGWYRIASMQGTGSALVYLATSGTNMSALRVFHLSWVMNNMQIHMVGSTGYGNYLPNFALWDNGAAGGGQQYLDIETTVNGAASFLRAEWWTTDNAGFQFAGFDLQATEIAAPAGTSTPWPAI